ncbi:MAG: helix-turn-helix domain-containing protein [Sphingobium sp.]
MKQPLSEWPGDTASLLIEMRRRAGVRTDQELAKFMGVAQSTVANWRKRDAVPNSAILKFEFALDNPRDLDFARLLAARAIAMRLPEILHQRMRKGGAVGRYLSYTMVAGTLDGITSEIVRQIERLQEQSGLSIDEIGPRLIEDEVFLGGLADWMSDTSWAEMVHRQSQTVERVRT